MTDKYNIARAFRDTETKLVVPNLKISAINAITNIASTYVTNPTRLSQGFFSSADKFGNPFEDVKSGIKSAVTNLVDKLTIGLGVTKIETSQEYTMPFSKGIGSTGEVIHLLGAKNEIINLEFKTDKYPGRLAYSLRGILQKILEDTEVVYLIDDLFLATPCLIRKMKLSKEGIYRGAVMGELELVSLTTGGGFLDNVLGGSNKISGFVKKLKGNAKIVSIVASSTTKAVVVGVGALAVTGALVSGILGSG